MCLCYVCYDEFEAQCKDKFFTKDFNWRTCKLEDYEKFLMNIESSKENSSERIILFDDE